jgi:hypothetical protein
MCRLVIRVAFVGVTCSSFALPASAAAREGSLHHRHVLRVPDNDRLTVAHLGRLAQQSATARALIDALESIPDTVLIVRANPLLAARERVFGRGRFWTAGGRLYGVLEYQAEPLGNRPALRVLAHELAHALELATSASRRDAAALHSFVLSREVGDRVNDSPGIETEFACAIGSRVALELLGKVAALSALTDIARRFAVDVPRPAENPWIVLAENE